MKHAGSIKCAIKDDKKTIKYDINNTKYNSMLKTNHDLHANARPIDCSGVEADPLAVFGCRDSQIQAHANSKSRYRPSDVVQLASQDRHDLCQ